MVEITVEDLVDGLIEASTSMLNCRENNTILFHDQKNRDKRGRGRGKQSRWGAFHRKCFHCREEQHVAFQCSQCQQMKDKRTKDQIKVLCVHEITKLSHSKDV